MDKHVDGTTYTINWGDSSPTSTTTTNTGTHTYSAYGPFTIIVSADNELSTITSNLDINVYDRITGDYY